MEQAPPFRIGERVRLIVAFDTLPQGVCGRILATLHPASVYRVQFDGDDRPRLIYSPDLAHEPEVNESP